MYDDDDVEVTETKNCPLGMRHDLLTESPPAGGCRQHRDGHRDMVGSARTTPIGRRAAESGVRTMRSRSLGSGRMWRSGTLSSDHSLARKGRIAHGRVMTASTWIDQGKDGDGRPWSP